MSVIANRKVRWSLTKVNHVNSLLPDCAVRRNRRHGDDSFLLHIVGSQVIGARVWTVPVNLASALVSVIIKIKLAFTPRG